jgi:hypothetical protein
MASEGRDVSQKMADWVIAELRYKAKLFRETNAIIVYNADVVESDIAVPTEIKQALQESARNMENVPEFYKDYHPGSDETVLNLVHPSLFPLVYGRSRVLSNSLIGLDDCIESCGKGEVVPIPLPIPPDLDMFLSPAAEPHSFRSPWPLQGSDPPYSQNFQVSVLQRMNSYSCSTWWKVSRHFLRIRFIL